MKDQYVVVGNPVAHSRSPLIHTRFALASGQDMEYRRQLVPPGGFAAAAARFFAEGGKGMNVTLPFKLDAFAFADRRSERAQRAGAANTLWLADGRVHADNTDGPGLVRDLSCNLAWPLQGARVLLLGAGGAVRGVLAPLLACRPASITIANRNVARAHALAASFADMGPVSACAYAELVPGQRFDLVINGTSASLQHEVPPVPDALFRGVACYDMVYADEPTAFLARARAAGASTCADGLGMLVEQAAEAFLLWRGLRPATAEVIRVLRRRVTIRPLRDERDRELLATLRRECRRHGNTATVDERDEKKIEEAASHHPAPTAIELLAFSGDEAIGCAVVLAVGHDVCELASLWIHPAHRGGGTGRALARAAMDAAEAAGHAVMWLRAPLSKEATGLCESLGFHRSLARRDGATCAADCWQRDLRATTVEEGFR